MKAMDELAARAVAVAKEIAEGALGAPVQVRPEATAQAWHQTLLRNVFEQRMSVWKAFAFLDLIVGPTDDVVGYIDHDAYRRADDASELDDEDLRALIVDDELLPPRSRIVGRSTYAGPEGGRLVAATVESPDGRRWLVEMNCARRLVAAIRPLEPGESV